MDAARNEPAGPVPLRLEALSGPLERRLAALAGADNVALSSIEKLSGGSVQQNWRLDVEVSGGAFEGARRWVLRTDGLTGLGLGLDRCGEFEVLRHVHGAGVAVPEPLFVCADTAVIGRPFLVTRWARGIGRGRDLVALAGTTAGDALAERLGRELALVHQLCPAGTAPACLGAAPSDPAAKRIAAYERVLDEESSPHPVAEWGLRWLERHRPAPAAPALCHGDFRTGNYLVDGGALTAILDWEFAAWSDPDEDVGWFCSRCWRFGADRYEAGGIGTRATFLRGYEAVARRRVDPARLHYWEVMAALRWLLIALRQRDRFLIQGERSLDLALTGRRPAECEWEILRLLDEPEAA